MSANTILDRQQQQQQQKRSKAVQIALQFNNVGIYHLRKGNLDAAWELLKGGIDVMLQSSMTYNAENNSTTTSSRIEPKSVKNAYRILIKTKADLTKKNNSQDTTKTAGYAPTTSRITEYQQFTKSAGFVYQHGMMIEPSFIKRQRRNDYALCSMLSSVILYNMALLHHRACLEEVEENDDEDKEKLLYLALDLYKKADCLIEELLYKQQVKVHTIIELHMTILNNIAVVLNDLGRYDHSRDCLHRLRRTIHYYTTSSNTTEIIVTEDGKERKIRSNFIGNNNTNNRRNRITHISGLSKCIDDFITNILFLKEPRTAGAA